MEHLGSARLVQLPRSPAWKQQSQAQLTPSSQPSSRQQTSAHRSWSQHSRHPTQQVWQQPSKSGLAGLLPHLARPARILAGRATDGFAAAAPQLQFPNPPMATTAITTCSATNIQYWQQLKVPLVKAFTPGVDTEFPPASYSLLSGPTQTRVSPSAAM
jgi:hypothetical protein